MLLKARDDKSAVTAELERLLAEAPASRRPDIEKELRIVRAGLKGEADAAYYIDFALKESKNTLVIHDLRLECNGRVAQIDHLLLHRTLNFFVLETKHFHAGIKITEEGEFLRWNDYKRTYEGMASPLAQNDRHIAVLTDACERIAFPTRLGVRLTPVFQSYVLVSPSARIDRPRRFDTSRIIKADMIEKMFDESLDNAGVLDTLSNMSRFVATETLESIGRQLVRHHRAETIDYRARFGFPKAGPERGDAATATTSAPPPAPAPAVESVSPAVSRPTCRHCGSPRVAIQYGKYGYYFKCGACDGNTAIKVTCGKPGHHERLRKDGAAFHRECADCGTRSIFFINPSAT